MRFSQKEVVPLYTKIYDMCEMTIENVLSAYDVIGKNLGYLISYGNWANFAMRKKDAKNFNMRQQHLICNPMQQILLGDFILAHILPGSIQMENPYVILHLRMLLQMPFCIGKVATNLYRMQY